VWCGEVAEQKSFGMSVNGVGGRLEHEKLFDNVTSLVKEYLIKNKKDSNKVTPMFFSSDLCGESICASCGTMSTDVSYSCNSANVYQCSNAVEDQLYR